MTEKTLFVQFGGTGDLAKRKLYPAYHELFKKGFDFDVISLGRRFKDRKEFIDKMDIGGEENFKNRLNYLKFDIESAHSKDDLRDYIKDHLSKGNVEIVFYLAVLPEHYSKIMSVIRQISDDLDLADKKAVLEKPFGYDMKSAKDYENDVLKVFKEEDIFRVDHYLGKEFIQNILVMRFTNEIIRGIWNKDYVDHIQIILDEKVGVEQRTDYYDKVGVIRDMVQNHILQLVNHVVMDEPDNFTHEKISEQKIKVLKSIEGMDDYALARYSSYKGDPDSATPTFASLKLHVNHGKLSGVPIYIRTGKKQGDQRSMIYIQFKDSVSEAEKREHVPPNSMTIDIQPNMKIDLSLNVKKPHESWNAHPVNFNFNHFETFKENTPEAYEQIIEKVLHSDKTLFPSKEEILESWRIVEKILYDKEAVVQDYDPGCRPKNSDEMIQKDNRSWLI